MSKRPNFLGMGRATPPISHVVPAGSEPEQAGEALQPVAVLQRRIEETIVPQASPKGMRTPSRRGKKGLLIWVDKACSKQLAQIALNEDTSKEALLKQALNDLFDKRGFARLA
jgi:hypothetical protein